jgi:hypothetical protein
MIVRIKVVSMKEAVNRLCLWPDCENPPVKHVRYDYNFERPILPREGQTRGVEIPFQYQHGDICEKHLGELCQQQRVSQIGFGVCCP